MKKQPSFRKISRRLAIALGSFWLAGACGGATGGTPVIGSESHFLMRCTDTCDSDLSCISGICTRSCIAGRDSCSDLASAAVCTNQSVEPGAVAVCDVSCSGRQDCAALGEGHVCDAGYCRLSAASGARLSQLICEEYLDQSPPPSEPPGVTIVNTGTQTVYIHPIAPACTGATSLVGVQRVSAGGDRSDVNIYGAACAPTCNDTAANGWRHEGEGDLRQLMDCIGVACPGPGAAVALEPGASLFESARLEVAPGILPRGCATGITTDVVNCFRRVIPADTGNYLVSVAVSATPECDAGCERTRFESAPTRWFFEPVTLEVAIP